MVKRLKKIFSDAVAVLLLILLHVSFQSLIDIKTAPLTPHNVRPLQGGRVLYTSSLLKLYFMQIRTAIFWQFLRKSCLNQQRQLFRYLPTVVPYVPSSIHTGTIQ